ncbi:MAG: DUF479 domain-containing protein [Burkholderiales bacterium]|nr:DUF479 domain-containing protein [Burkholderiales bacterium]
MNFLAHLYLTPDTPDGLLGSLLGDFVKGPLDQAGYAPDVTAAIKLHRRIDTFTDAHPVVLASKARLGPDLRRYAGILVDVYYDHFLAKSWERLHPEPLPAFARRVYGELEAHPHPVPDAFARMLPWLVRQDWLASYRSVDGVHEALTRMQRRFSRPTPLAEGAAALQRHYDDFAADFAAFLPEVRQQALAEIDGSRSSDPEP